MAFRAVPIRVAHFVQTGRHVCDPGRVLGKGDDLGGGGGCAAGQLVITAGGVGARVAGIVFGGADGAAQTERDAGGGEGEGERAAEG